MHIIIFSSSTNRSGGTRQAAYQAKALTELGHNVVFLIPETSQMWNETGETYWKKLPTDPKKWRNVIESYFPDNEPAIVHAFHNKAVKLASWWGLFWRKKKVICVSHRGVIFRPNNPLPYLSPGLAMVIPNSLACVKKLNWHCPKNKIHFVQNGIPLERLTPSKSIEEIKTEFAIKPSEFLFCSIGNNTPVKGGDILLEAFAKAKLANTKLILIGFSREKYLPIAQKLEIEDKCIFVGHQENVSNYLQVSDAFIFPSRGMDSSPNTLLEAICMGLPIVACSVGGVPEIIDGNGLITPIEDTSALAKALITLRNDPELCAKFAQRSKELRERFDIKTRAKSLEKIYQNLISRLK
ncbi:glycosyltransferase family 4 protein [Desulfovibrio litoralis]|uniref:Glycosyltransferase involved in cell wall bisynthesis n=1 Tax=Desulfovibrio litoralis DSM 11393 TaxID=1121455 RepID=A0A1M7TEB7_9BACT|nr:glycosyltransferase family 4 protein [Desulfovibrio litoralis]SHN69027.1 Glycosyltransferase involved in cell wall bisynthesis [Desulfovibrio litoralis DSM 11393]